MRAKRDAQGPRSAEPAGAARVRKASPALARLRAQPSAPLASSRPRPRGSRRLSDVPLNEDEVLIDAFDAILDGVTVRVTAVLERTCVYLDGSGDRRLAKKNDLWVEASRLPIRRRGIS
jgi:hypothetical protein